MVYSSSSVAYLVNSIESHTRDTLSNNFSGTDSIQTRSIAASAHSSASASSCKSISEPVVLLSRAVKDLKVTAAEFRSEDSGSEYWDTWSYWKRHPFIIGHPELMGNLLFEHLIILTNIKSSLALDFTDSLFQDLKAWHLSHTRSNGKAHNATHDDQEKKLFDCFFCNYLEHETETSFKLIKDLQATSSTITTQPLTNLFDDIITQLNSSKLRNNRPLINNNPKQIFQLHFDSFQVALSQFRAFALSLLQKLKSFRPDLGFLVDLIKRSRNAFIKFCKKLFFIIMNMML